MTDLRVANYLTTGGFTCRPLDNFQKFLVYLLRQAPYTAAELAYLTQQPLTDINTAINWMRTHGLVKRLMEVVPELPIAPSLFDLVERSARYGRRSQNHGRAYLAA